MFKFIDKILYKNTKYYDHYISLGYNCECAYRFFYEYNFVESSLFTWTNSIKITNLIKALSNISIILSHEPELAGVMWRCVDTDIRFHGTEPNSMHSKKEEYSIEDFVPYKKELISRINHLKKKFITQISDNKRTLLTYSYKIQNETDFQILENIYMLKKTLTDIGANNFELLIILEKQKTNSIENINNENVYIRYVNNFAPEDDVTTKEYDKYSWKKIFKEFKPNFKLKKRKKFKFEEI